MPAVRKALASSFTSASSEPSNETLLDELLSFDSTSMVLTLRVTTEKLTSTSATTPLRLRRPARPGEMSLTLVTLIALAGSPKTPATPMMKEAHTDAVNVALE